jgi:YVTN family beta-propeller protein
MPALAALLIGGAGCETFEGIDAPTDALHFPQGVAVHPSGRYVYVVNTNFDISYDEEDGGTITVIDADTLEIVPEATLRIGSYGGEVVLSEDARRMYVAVRANNSVVRLDVSEDGSRVTCEGGMDTGPCTIAGLAPDPYALAVTERRLTLDTGAEVEVEILLVTHLRSTVLTALSILDGDLSTLARIETELVSGGSAVARNPRTGEYYVVGRFDGRVRVMTPAVGVDGDIAALVGLDEVSLPNSAATYDARDILFTPEGDRAFVAARSPNTLLVIDTSPRNRQGSGAARDELVGQIDLLGAPEALALVSEPSGDTLYVVQLGSNDMLAIDVATGLEVGRFDVGRAPSGVAADTVRHQRLYVPLFREAALAVVDIDPNSPRFRSAVAKIR